MKKRLIALTLALMLAGTALAETGVRLFAVNVGTGDALILTVGDCAVLIDAGKAKAMGRVRSALKALGVDRLDAVLLTHTDDDHAEGLSWLAESDIPVGTWYASAMYTGVKEKKHPAVKAAAARGQSVAWLRRGDSVPLGDTGAALDVLAPISLAADKDDNNSLVMMLRTDQGRMLLTGDMELPEEAELIGMGDDLSCAVLKVPNHGDGDATGQALAEAASAQIAVISTDSGEKPGTPDGEVVSRLMRAGTTCWVTQDSGLGVDVRLEGGAAAAEYLPIDGAVNTGVVLTEVVPGEDLVTLYNGGDAADLTGWYLYSDRGDELYAFPEGCVLAAGASVTVGSRSSRSGAYDLLWDDKKVIHKSKPDEISLYDGYGRIVDSLDNGN